MQEELKKPGTHINKDWVHPDIKRRRRLSAEAWAKRDIDLSDVTTSLNPPKEAPQANWRDPDPAPEPIEELLRIPHITIDQIAKMKKITPDAVRAAAVDLRIPMDAGIAAAIAQASTEAQFRDAYAKTDLATSGMVSQYAEYELIDNLDDRIAVMLDDQVPMVVMYNMARKLDPSMSYEQLKLQIAKLSAPKVATTHG